jgi:hypothetical protein
LRLANAGQRLLVSEIHFDIPALKVSFDYLAWVHPRIGANEISGIPVKELRSFWRACRRGLPSVVWRPAICSDMLLIIQEGNSMRARSIRNLLFGAMLAAGLHAQNQQPPKTHLKEGDMAPDFTLTATTGGKVKLSDFRGKSNVVLAFFPAAFTGG